MSFQLRYKQPFTITQASQLDANIIFQEITRLENSLSHLRNTQEELTKYISESQDPDVQTLKDAYRENEEVIGSQRERISMLMFVLREKGIIGPETKSVPHAPQNTQTNVSAVENSVSSVVSSSSGENATDEGVFL